MDIKKQVKAFMRALLGMIIKLIGSQPVALRPISWG